MCISLFVATRNSLVQIHPIDAQAAIDAYVGFFQTVDQGFADPGRDWTSQVAQYATGPAKQGLLTALEQTALRGQHGTGATQLFPVVDSVEPALVKMTVCLDSSKSDIQDSSGTSIKSPNVAGTYWRVVSKVQLPSM